MRRTIAIVLSAALMTSGCASAGQPRLQAVPAVRSYVDASLMASYVKQLPIGSRVRVKLADGHGLSGTLMKVDDRAIVIQPRTRIYEQPVEIGLDQLAAVELELKGGNSLGKTVGVAMAASAAGVLAVFLVLAAIYAGD